MGNPHFDYSSSGKSEGQAEPDVSRNDTLSGLVFLAAVLGVGFIGCRYFFPSDRAEVAACISAMMEAGRGTGEYGYFRHFLNQVEAADEVVMTDINRTPFGPYDMIDISYTADGQSSGIECAG